ncbi:transmembrane protein, putative (macronuclear) [Tetrahymena thermophila SB210]|uniref:Transmembrane protein, putative n=1 Tax=Tetrahymena thermophila (strain SB210) TaxID=312017 RepID=W7XC39_TETTS|nr:transmembrane protein, putative [Tetrahymena thermophila SB210]EWS74942.1 transmembrane protein, putative [Tetrahymena thermophila SB210]|eukprot:XP_012652531.1 transmembrane protein, putative [Tetrahymena thermophila SB210]
MEFNIDIVVKFSPLNLLFIVYSITQTSSIQVKKPKQQNDSDKKQTNDMQTQQGKIEDTKEKKTSTRVTIFELLGKHDCFRVMVLIMAYIYLYSIVEATKAKSIVYLLPLFIFSKTFYTTAILFRQEKYNKAKTQGCFLYLLYVFFYIACLHYS